MSLIREELLLPVLEKAGYASYELRREFTSKRNHVFLLALQRRPQLRLQDAEAQREIDALASMGLFETGQSCDCGGAGCSGCQEDCPSAAPEELAVWKQYELGDTAYELSMIGLLRNYHVKTPLVLAASGQGILMQYIPGSNLCELFEQAERDGDYAEEIVIELARWLKSYYQATGGKSRGDVNLRNFIYNEGENCLYGLDFEETLFRSPAYDVGNLLAYLINYDPAFTAWKCEWVKRVASAFIMELNLSTEEVKRQYVAALSDTELRRCVSIPEYIYVLLDEL